MNVKLLFFEKYSIAPSPNRDYYGIKVFANEVILYHWRISHGPHLSPLVCVIKFSVFRQDKAAKELIEHVFGTNVLRYLELAASSGPNTLLTLPKEIIGKLVAYLNLKDITELLRTSAISREVFDTDSVWKILYERLKASTDLSEMEKEVAANREFKKLVKNHQARSTVKKSIKLMDNEPKRSQTAMSKSAKVTRSASVNIPKTTLQGDMKRTAGNQPASTGHSRKVQTALKSSFAKTDGEGKEQILLHLPKKSMSEEKSSIIGESGQFAEKNIAIEGYRSFKSIDGTATKKPSAEKKVKVMSKLFKFVNEDRQKTDLLLPKKFLKSTIVGSNLSDSDVPAELLKSKSMTVARPKGGGKRSSHALGDSKVKLQSQVGKGQKSWVSACGKEQKSLNAASKSAKNEERSGGDDSDESGMSFLMKRYLEASSQVASKFSECQRLTSATKNSSVQVDMSEKAGRKPPRKMQKYAPFLEKSVARKKLC